MPSEGRGLSGERVPLPELQRLADADALRGHLDALNEDGQTPVVVGWTAPPHPQPFLITLIGCYADSEAVFFDSPWQSDIEWREGHANCDECNGWSHGIEHLRYPVTVLAAVSDV